MRTKIAIDWTEDMSFKSEVNGHEIIIDAGEAVGGKDRGPRPKPLMLLALAGCTGMDVISILKKMRVELDDFRVSVDANNTEEHPKHYNDIKVIYEFRGKDLEKSRDKIEKAVNLSEERYCGVSHIYKQAVELSNEIIIHES
ncbi:MAG: OsmC family protein [Bacteroidales bacterium]